MVYFSCGSCGDSIKKPQVEQHLYKCRNAKLSCLDCGLDFVGKTYQKHVQCISEAEKYSGGNFKPKPNATKSVNKNMLWKQALLDSVQELNMPENKRERLLIIVNRSSLPRAKPRFENFFHNNQSLNDMSNFLMSMFEKATEKWNAIQGNTAQAGGVANIVDREGKNFVAASNTGDSVQQKYVKDDAAEPAKNGKRSKDKKVLATEEEGYPVYHKPGKSKQIETKQSIKSNEIQETDKAHAEEVVPIHIKKEKKDRAGKETLVVSSIETEIPDAIAKSKKNKNVCLDVTREIVPGENFSKCKLAESTEKDKRGEHKCKGRENNEVGLAQSDEAVIAKKEKKCRHSNWEQENEEQSVQVVGILVERKNKLKKGEIQVEKGDEHKHDKKKRKREHNDWDVAEATVAVTKKSKKVAGEPEEQINNEDLVPKGKFKIESVVKKILKKSDDNEMSFRKLKKKVLAEYVLSSADHELMTKEKLETKLLKKISKNPSFKYLKDKVTLLKND